MNLNKNKKDAKVELGLGPALHQFFCPGSEIWAAQPSPKLWPEGLCWCRPGCWEDEKGMGAEHLCPVAPAGLHQWLALSCSLEGM